MHTTPTRILHLPVLALACLLVASTASGSSSRNPVQAAAAGDIPSLEAIDASVKAQMAEAVRFADESPFPPLEDAFTHVWPN